MATQPQSDVSDMFQRMGERLGWFEHKDLSTAIKSLASTGKKKPARPRLTRKVAKSSSSEEEQIRAGSQSKPGKQNATDCKKTSVAHGNSKVTLPRKLEHDKKTPDTRDQVADSPEEIPVKRVPGHTNLHQLLGFRVDDSDDTGSYSGEGSAYRSKGGNHRPARLVLSSSDSDSDRSDMEDTYVSCIAESFVDSSKGGKSPKTVESSPDGYNISVVKGRQSSSSFSHDWDSSSIGEPLVESTRIHRRSSITYCQIFNSSEDVVPHSNHNSGHGQVKATSIPASANVPDSSHSVGENAVRRTMADLEAMCGELENLSVIEVNPTPAQDSTGSSESWHLHLSPSQPSQHSKIHVQAKPPVFPCTKAGPESQLFSSDSDSDDLTFQTCKSRVLVQKNAVSGSTGKQCFVPGAGSPGNLIDAEPALSTGEESFEVMDVSTQTDLVGECTERETEERCEDSEKLTDSLLSTVSDCDLTLDYEVPTSKHSLGEEWSDTSDISHLTDSGRKNCKNVSVSVCDSNEESIYEVTDAAVQTEELGCSSSPVDAPPMLTSPTSGRIQHKVVSTAVQSEYTGCKYSPQYRQAEHIVKSPTLDDTEEAMTSPRPACSISSPTCLSKPPSRRNIFETFDPTTTETPDLDATDRNITENYDCEDSTVYSDSQTSLRTGSSNSVVDRQESSVEMGTGETTHSDIEGLEKSVGSAETEQSFHSTASPGASVTGGVVEESDDNLASHDSNDSVDDVHSSSRQSEDEQEDEVAECVSESDSSINHNHGNDLSRNVSMENDGESSESEVEEEPKSYLPNESVYYDASGDSSMPKDSKTGGDLGGLLGGTCKQPVTGKSMAQKPAVDTSWRGKSRSDSSSDDDDLESYFQKLRKPVKKKLSSDDEGKSMKEFIVEDDEMSSESDDSVFYIKKDRELPSLKARIKQAKGPELLFSSDDEDFQPDLYPRSVQKKKSSTQQAETPVSSDSDDSLFFKLPTPLVRRTQKKPSTPQVKNPSTPQVKKPSTPQVKKPSTPLVKTPAPTSMKTPAPTSMKTPTSVSMKTPTSITVVGFMESLSNSMDDRKRHPDARRFISGFKKLKEELPAQLFRVFNRTVFDNQLPADLPIIWNKRLLRTAGYCAYKRTHGNKEERTARIELSTKVCDSAERVRDTLVHELCHAAVWLVNGARDGHGPYWKYWARQANHAHPDIPVIARCHNYSINTKFTYRCTKCGYSIGRHSKSLDTEKKVCGYCHGTFELLAGSVATPSDPTATPKTPRTPNRFALYVKEHYSTIKKQDKNLKHGDVMKALSKQFAEMNKISNE